MSIHLIEISAARSIDCIRCRGGSEIRYGVWETSHVYNAYSYFGQYPAKEIRMSDRKVTETEVHPLTVEEIKTEMFSEVSRMLRNDLSDPATPSKNNRSSDIDNAKSTL
jgi:hypothetical protein